MQNIIKKYKAVSQECRFRIIHILLKAKTPLCICEMIDIFKKEQYQISRCLGILKQAGLITEDRDGRLLLYSLNQSDPINKSIFESVIKDQTINQFKNDLIAMKKRLALRKNGKIVVTYHN